MNLFIIPFWTSMINNDNLKRYWELPVSELVTLSLNPLVEEQKERHRLYSLLLMAIVYHFWNGLKRGREGKYPLSVNAATTEGKYLKNDYRGHNIAAIAVDGDGNIIDLEFNHNALFNSSAEHAESRLIRRVYSLTSVHDSWRVKQNRSLSRDDYNSFEEVTVYTSLESCAQCAGVMALARVKEVVFLQTDPSMYMIGNILRNLTRSTKLESPEPIAGSLLNFPYFNFLDTEFSTFRSRVSTSMPFFIPNSPNDKPDISPSITSFLCTKVAYDIYRMAYDEFMSIISGKLILHYPEYQPTDKEGKPIKTSLKNTDVLEEIASFYSYASINGRRATPHH